MGGFDLGAIVAVLPFLLKGLAYTVQLTVVAAIGGTLLGIVLALARLSSIKPLSQCKKVGNCAALCAV